MNLINKLHDEFLDEAKKSPVLLSDLANLEKYISESYSERSLIELIQNADDANATGFYISILNDNAVLVANNGDFFSEEDVIALCRSGSSTKKRKSNTIGYRGIGFKSIVNYTNNVHVYSGDVKLSFSKELTRKDLPDIDNVPLVRIPHEFNGEQYLNDINAVLDAGFTTVFIFETKSNSIVDEIKAFDESCLLFLRNLETFTSKTEEIYEIKANRLKIDDKDMVSIKSRGDETKWLIINDYQNDERINIAFLLENGKATLLDKEYAVIHSFMPTKNKFCIPCKINGDFSTDPSRTKVVIDEESMNVINSIAELFSKIISQVVNDNKDDYNLISIISSIYIDPLSQFKTKDINDQFIDELKMKIIEKLDINEILIQPDWLSEDSFNEIYRNTGKILITDTTDESIHGIKKLLLTLGFKEPDYDATMIKASENKYSEDTRVDLTVKSIEKTRFTVDDNDKQSINNAYMIEARSGVKKTKDLGNSKVSKEFESKVKNKLNDETDFNWFAKKFKIKHDKPKEEKPIKSTQTNYNKKSDKIVRFKKKSNLTKWRSVETNVIEYLKETDNYKTVEDVSLMNVGYDAKTIDKQGNEKYFEIKSVRTLGDPIKITNNEYTHAHKYKYQYNLIVASQQENHIEMCIIENPIEKLDLTKRIVQVEWICNEYEGKYLKTYFEE